MQKARTVRLSVFVMLLLMPGVVGLHLWQLWMFKQGVATRLQFDFTARWSREIMEHDPHGPGIIIRSTQSPRWVVLWSDGHVISNLDSLRPKWQRLLRVIQESYGVHAQVGGWSQDIDEERYNTLSLLEENEVELFVDVKEIGWPFASCVVIRITTLAIVFGEVKTETRWIGRKIGSDASGLSLMVRPLGILANMILISFIALAPIGWKYGKSEYRKRRGRCGHCGYPTVKGVRVCPECGKDNLGASMMVLR